MERTAERLRRSGPTGRGPNRASPACQNVARPAGDIHRVATACIDHGAEQLAPIARVRGDYGRAAHLRECLLEGRLGGGRVVQREDQDGGLGTDPEWLEPAPQLGRVEA